MSLLVIQNLVTLVLRVIPGPNLRLGARHAPMEYESSMNCSTFFIRGDLDQFHLCSFPGPIEIPGVEFGEGDNSTQAETRRQRRSRSARISRRLVPLARSASAPIDFSGRDHSQTLLV